MGKSIRLCSMLFVFCLVIGQVSANSNQFISQATIGTAGFTITAPGTYTLTEDITFSGVSTVITVDSDDVTLDLNGKHIAGTGIADIAIKVGREGAPGVGHKNITIRNGALTGFAFGIRIFLSSRVFLSDIQVETLTFLVLEIVITQGPYTSNMSSVITECSIDELFNKSMDCYR